MLRPYKDNRSQPRGLRRLLRNIQQHTRRQQHHQQTRASVADERQRDSFRGHHPSNHGKINQRLAQDHGGDSHRQQAPESVRSAERGTHFPASHK